MVGILAFRFWMKLMLVCKFPKGNHNQNYKVPQRFRFYTFKTDTGSTMVECELNQLTVFTFFSFLSRYFFILSPLNLVMETTCIYSVFFIAKFR
jgi:hypothetical protein